MKNILGLDLGTTSIGWAYVLEAENKNEKSEILKLGVRVNPLTTDEQSDFEKGKSISINADRTLKRGARRNLDRYKLRRENLIEILLANNLITTETILAETGNRKTFETLKIRAKAANNKIAINEFARVLLAINKKRGYKSSRRAKNEDEGQIIDGMAVAKRLYEENITPGQLCLQLLKEGRKVLPDFYRSDLQTEFDSVWNEQKLHYPEVFTDEFHKMLQGQGLQNTRKFFLKQYEIYTADNKGSRDEKKIQAYSWRSKAISEKLELSEVAYVITEINNDLNKSSGYLGEISDRSKELYFNKLTVGQYLYQQVQANPNTRLKGQVFYRQDYMDEFEQIWNTQQQFYPELTEELKSEIRDVVIFYQRKLKSQKALISFCEFENFQKELMVEGKTKLKTIGARVAPKSSPLFQECKIWQNLSNVIVRNKLTKEEYAFDLLTKQMLFDELNIKGNLTKNEILKLLGKRPSDWEMNYTELQGNLTNQKLYEAYKKMIEINSDDDFDYSKMTAYEIKDLVRSVLIPEGVKEEVFEFDALLEGKAFEQQTFFQLWHLLYSYEGDNSKTGNNLLYKVLNEKFGFKRKYAQILANVELPDDYGNLSTKAMRKIMPYLKENKYSDACLLAGYNHSASVTKDENEKRVLKNKLEILPKNSLRNPVVEKILNQMVNVVNAIIEDENLGKPDEIRIELARELKKNAKERAEMTQNISKAKDEHEKYRKILQNEFGIQNPSRNDLIRYKLYLELEPNGFKTLYSNTYLSPDKLFSKEIDIEHIIPKARLFDDSFSNKTLELRSFNTEKSDETAYDYMLSKFGEQSEQFNRYVSSIEELYKANKISKAKYHKLHKKGSDLGEGFIERDLRESQYIAKKAKDMLLELCRTVVSTTGSITGKLREDWGLIDVMKELNIEKYRMLGLTEIIQNRDGQTNERISDWTKRNDHRHHAMDALTVAFTKHNHIQYLNNLNARRNENHKKHGNIIAIENKETEKSANGKRVFKAPMNNFRSEAKRHLEKVLISYKAKNKVVTRNKNKLQGSSKSSQITLTPRGQMHKETIYGKSLKYTTKDVKVGTAFDEKLINTVTKKVYRDALIKRLAECNNDPKKAFGGKNSPAKNPIYYAVDKEVPQKVKIVELTDRYTIRKDIGSDLKIEKVIDKGIQRILQERLNSFNGNAKEAFSNLDKNPILNKNGHVIKRVTISGVSNAEPLHYKKDHLGKPILNNDGKYIPVDYVSTGNNHHVAIYRDEKGNLQEEVVSFFEAVARVNAGLPVINRDHPNGWEFLFTMKQNEMFVFPSETFDPTEIDLMNPYNNHLISPNLFRVQTLSVVKYGNNTIRDFKFKHHLETIATENKLMKGCTFHQIKSLEPLEKIIKVRLNHLGQIVKVGE